MVWNPPLLYQVQYRPLPSTNILCQFGAEIYLSVGIKGASMGFKVRLSLRLLFYTRATRWSAQHTEFVFSLPASPMWPALCSRQMLTLIRNNPKKIWFECDLGWCFTILKLSECWVWGECWDQMVLNSITDRFLSLCKDVGHWHVSHLL